MLKRSAFDAPRREPTEFELQEAATLFEEKGRFAPYLNSIALQVHSTEADQIERLAQAFGGGVYAIRATRTVRWRLARETLTGFLARIEPFLSSKGVARIQAAREALGIELDPAAERRAKREIEVLAQEAIRRAALRAGEDES